MKLKLKRGKKISLEEGRSVEIWLPDKVTQSIPDKGTIHLAITESSEICYYVNGVEVYRVRKDEV